MKTHFSKTHRKGFTLMEMMVSMAITAIIVTIMVTVTRIAIDTWTRSRLELRASRQAKAMLDVMSADLEAMVVRKGNTNNWFFAQTLDDLPGTGVTSTNAADLIFFTAAPDRYNAGVGTTRDEGGDVSCVAYQLAYRDPLAADGNDYQTYVLNRKLVNPDETFTNLLGATDPDLNLQSVFNQFYGANIADAENFVCENIFQFTLTFNVRVLQNYQYAIVPIVLGASGDTKEFQINGTGIETDAAPTGYTRQEIEAGQLESITVSITVLTDAAADQARTRSLAGENLAEFLNKNSYQFSKQIPVPSP